MPDRGTRHATRTHTRFMLITYAFLFVMPGGPAALLEAPEFNLLPLNPPALARALFLPDDAEDSGWTGSVDVGATLSSGNSDILTGSVQTAHEKTLGKHRLTLKAGWAFAEQSNATTGLTSVSQRNWFGSGKLDHFYSDETYSYASVKVENDDIANLNLRQTYSAGLGRKFVDEDDFKFEGEAGLAYVDENYATTGAVAQADDEYFALRLAYDLFKQLTDSWTFLQSVELVPSLSFSEFNGIADSRLRNQMSENLAFQLQWIAKYNNNAPAGSASTDSLWLVSLGWTY